MQRVKECDINMAKKIEQLDLSKRFSEPTSFGIILIIIRRRKTHKSLFSALVIVMLLMYSRKLLGHELDKCAIGELKQIENQLERSISKIRARKVLF